MKKTILISLIIGLIAIVLPKSPPKDVSNKDLKEKLGREIFFDENLSVPVGQSCATCHGKEVGWSGPDSKINKETAVYPGALEPLFGNRRPPSIAYTKFAPNLFIDNSDGEETFTGGLFWDGRATGWEINDPLAEQAMGPFLNPLEQNVMDKKLLVKKIMAASYADLFRQVWGKNSLSLKNYEKTFQLIAISIGAFERSAEVNPFNSQFDDFWRKTRKAGLDVEKISAENMNKYKGFGLNKNELNGLMLFNTKALCAECHVLSPIDSNPPVFTDFTYDNLGVPNNPNNPFYKVGKPHNTLGDKWLDYGLGAFLETTKKYKKYARANYGKHKVPTLRNVDLRPDEKFVKTYMHNGCFTSLKEVVDFYNTRDVAGKKWPDPEVKENINKDELGDLKLTDAEVNDIVLFMKTLSDRLSE